MQTVVLYDNHSGTAPSPDVKIEGRRSLYRVTVFGATTGTIQLNLKDPWGNPVPIPNAESSANDTYEVTLNPGDIINASVTTGTPSGLYVALRSLAT